MDKQTLAIQEEQKGQEMREEWEGKKIWKQNKMEEKDWKTRKLNTTEGEVIQTIL